MVLFVAPSSKYLSFTALSGQRSPSFDLLFNNGKKAESIRLVRKTSWLLFGQVIWIVDFQQRGNWFEYLAINCVARD